MRLGLCLLALLVVVSLASAGSTVELSAASLTINGVAAGDQSGYSVSSGDVNGDGKDDVIIGAYFADPGGRTDAGASYVVFGGGTGAISLSSADLTLTGVTAGDNSGYSVSSGNVNHDGYDDIIIGANGANGLAGVTYVVFGGAAKTGVMSLSSADMIISGVAAGDNSGVSVSSGDVNGDLKDDVVIGANGANGYAGKTYVVFGGRMGAISLSTADLTLTGVTSADHSGYSVSSGNVNHDGYDDVVIGAPYADLGATNAGVTYVVFGGAAKTGVISLSSADLTLTGLAVSDNAGTSVSSGDVNGDGKDDVIIGAPYANPGGSTDAGASYVVFGGGTGAISLSSADLTLTGVTSRDYSGTSVSSGDVNHDGVDDVIIGASGADPGGKSGAGASYVVFGGGTGVMSLSSADMIISGVAAGDNSGVSVSSGDVNGDGVDDVIIGANGANSGAGSSYVVFGVSPLSLSPSLSGLGSGGKVVAGRSFVVSGGVSCAGGSCGAVSLALDPVLHRAFGGWLRGSLLS